jgi:hypothetical protein
MAKKKEKDVEEHAELLPPREALSLLNTDPSSYASLLGGTPDPTAGTADSAASTAGSAHDLADAQAAGDAQQTVSEDPQTVITDSQQTASSET